jgi:valyl-tRNA synthetase
MVFQGLEFTDKRPFKDCLIHGLIRDKEGRKMSKSLGNGIDPMDMIEEYGADTLRFYLTTNSAPGQDLRFDEDKVKSTWNFINKIWNASRFTLMNVEDLKEFDYSNLTFSDKWILTKLNDVINSVRKNMDKYEFHNVGAELYNFIWNDFCDGYIEFSKFNMDNTSTKSTLVYVLTNILKLLHPFMPFVTEEIYSMLPIKECESIMTSSYPIFNKDLYFNDILELMDETRNFITKARIEKKDNNIKKDAKYKFESSNNDTYLLIKNVLKLTDDNIMNDNEKDFNLLNIESKTKILSNKLVFYYKVSNEELEKENANILKEIDNLKASILRREKLLSNEGYVNKAPKDLVLEEKNKLENEKISLKILEEKIK